MNTTDLYNKIVKGLPVIRKNTDFRVDLKDNLTEYLNNVKSLNPPIDKSIVDNIQQQINYILNIVNLYYAGQHPDAFSKINQLLVNLKTYNIKSDTFWFRARIFEDKREHTYKEMFHIPLSEREKVGPQRYGSSGYPCLYLGNTVYSCWEEMHRPHFDDVMFSGFKVSRDFDVYDLRIPKLADFVNDKIEKTLLCIPIIIASMIRVKNYNLPFKPEYIIPQLLTDAIICMNREEMETVQHAPYDLTWGIIFTSTHISSDFPYGADYLENVVLPVISSTGPKDYCQVLASLFEISDPLCCEYELLKDNIGISWEVADQSDEEKLREKYSNSKLGYLESKIKTDGNFKNFII